MLRNISLSVRKIQGRKEIKKVLATFLQWKEDIATLAPPPPAAKKLLIIRLDDIGDYLLFRNTLKAYRNAPQWQGYEITLLANQVWKGLYEYADNDAADKVIWVSKNDYFDKPASRKALWQSLRNEGFDTVICPARARPLLLDDACMLAAGAPHNIGSNNDMKYPEWNALSDTLYTTLYPQRNMMVHEFLFNVRFAEQCTGLRLDLDRPAIPAPQVNTGITTPYIVCFIGGSKKSHRWPAERWIELIQMAAKDDQYTIVLAGGKGDKDIADKVVAATQARSIVGEVTLPEVAGWMKGSAAIISNDTMSSHLAVSCDRPTLIVANGDNFYKFCDYKNAGIERVDNAYPDLFLNYWKKKHYKPFKNYVAVTKDIATIPANRVYNALQQLLTD